MSGPQYNDLKRQFLMERLLDAVKQCQIRFGGRKEIASDSDSRVICLCAQFEAVLQHGLKRSRGLTLTAAAAIKQAAGFSSKTETDAMFWVYVKEILNKHELQRFYSLKNITTDIGRGRAWLRCALNEHSLERYLHMLLGDTNRLSFFYEDWSFLFDEERSSMLPTMAAGLNSILFAINIDNVDLNGPAKTVPTVSHLLKESTQNVTSLLKESTQGVSSLLRDFTSSSAVSILIKPEQESDPLPVLSKSLTTDGKAKMERKKKKKVLTIISFDDDGDMEDPDRLNASKTLMSSIESSEKKTDRSSNVLPHFEAQFQLDLHDKENDDSSCVNGDFDYQKLVLESIDNEELDDYDTYEPETVSWSGDRDKSASCEQTPVGSSEHPRVCCWTPLQVLHDNSEVLFPVKAAGSYSHSGKHKKRLQASPRKGRREAPIPGPATEEESSPPSPTKQNPPELTVVQSTSDPPSFIQEQVEEQIECEELPQDVSSEDVLDSDKEQGVGEPVVCPSHDVPLCNVGKLRGEIIQCCKELENIKMAATDLQRRLTDCGDMLVKF